MRMSPAIFSADDQHRPVGRLLCDIYDLQGGEIHSDHLGKLGTIPWGLDLWMVGLGCGWTSHPAPVETKSGNTNTVKHGFNFENHPTYRECSIAMFDCQKIISWGDHGFSISMWVQPHVSIPICDWLIFGNNSEWDSNNIINQHGCQTQPKLPHCREYLMIRDLQPWHQGFATFFGRK